MNTFKEYMEEEKEETPLSKAERAILVGDHDAALKHLSQHVVGKSKVKDYQVSKYRYAIHKQKEREANA